MPTVLVVDDHEDTLDMMMRIIGSFGHRAISAKTGEAGLAIIVSEKPDLIIVDGMMPGMNGTEFIRLCRANQQTALIPIILHTALTDAQFSRDAIEKGVNEVWHKGKLDIDHMRNRLEYYLNNGTSR